MASSYLGVAAGRRRAEGKMVVTVEVVVVVVNDRERTNE
jgi:hypothetical protein